MTDDEMRQALRDPVKREKAFDLLISAGALVITSKNGKVTVSPNQTKGRKESL